MSSSLTWVFAKGMTFTVFYALGVTFALFLDNLFQFMAYVFFFASSCYHVLWRTKLSEVCFDCLHNLFHSLLHLFSSMGSSFLILEFELIS